MIADLPFFDQYNTYNAIPSVDRTAHKFTARSGLGKGASLAFTMLRSTTENEATNLEYDFSAYRGRISLRPTRKLRLNISGSRDQMVNDPVVIDLVALNGLTSAPTTTQATAKRWSA